MKTAWQADFGIVNGKRLRKSFDTKAEEENWLHEQRLVLEDQGRAAFGLTDAERMDAAKAREELKDVGGLPANAALQTVARVYAQCRKLMGESSASLAAAAEHDPSMVAALAVGFFAGLRSNELAQLDWKDIDLEAGNVIAFRAGSA